LQLVRILNPWSSCVGPTGSCGARRVVPWLPCMCTTSLATSPSSLHLKKPIVLLSVLLAHSRPPRSVPEHGRRAPPWSRAEQAPTTGHPRVPSVLLIAPPSCHSWPPLAKPVTADRDARTEPVTIDGKPSSVAAALAHPLSLLLPRQPHPSSSPLRAASSTPPSQPRSHRQPPSS
jgi:hypothetical protein